MKIKVVFDVDNDAFGEGYDDSQFGYAIETILKRLGKSFAGCTKKEVGEGQGYDDNCYDSNGNNVGLVTIIGYEPPKPTFEEWWEENDHSDALAKLDQVCPDFKVTVRATQNAETLKEEILKGIANGFINEGNLISKD